MQIEFYDEREFEKWLRALDGRESGRVAGKLALARDLGGPDAGMPLVRSLGKQLFEVRINKYRVYFTVRRQIMQV